jgi:hypothetical protein
MKQLVINYRSSFSYKLLAVIMFEWCVVYLVKWLEDADAVLREKTTFQFFR